MSTPYLRHPMIFLGSLVVRHGEVTEAAMWKSKPEVDRDPYGCFLEGEGLAPQAKKDGEKKRESGLSPPPSLTARQVS